MNKYRFRIDSSKHGHTIGLQTFCNHAGRIPDIIKQHQIEMPDCVSTVTEIDQTPAIPASNQMNTKHTPTHSWSIVETKGAIYIQEFNADVAKVFTRNDAARIIRAVNSYESLVAALHAMVKMSEDGDLTSDVITEAKQALAQAEGQR